MLFSLEVREPFMDYRLIEFVVGLPDQLKIAKGYMKYILREAITELPQKIRQRNHKMGFVAPDKIWMMENKERIRAELEEAIDNMGIFSGELLHRYDRFIKGELGYEPIYFRAITLKRFCKIFKMQLS
jgi:asparagine synthase (glutamine-hydrolysing)